MADQPAARTADPPDGPGRLIDERIATLTGRRRKLLARLAAASDPAKRPAALAPSPPPRLPHGQGVGAFYDIVTERLDRTEAGHWALFLNYGYAAGPDDRARIRLPSRAVNHASTKLVLELVGAVDLAGVDVLDVGCGRGGTVDVLLRYFAPRSAIGLDLSPAAVRFCTARHPGARFVVGDSGHLPFAAGSVDVVTNVESSHCYPDAAAFYAEVRRVLRPAGRFLYTDLLAAGSLDERRLLLAELGFTVDVDRDITANVLAACDAVASRRVAAFAGDPADLADFLAVPGSAPYEAMRTGGSRYVIWQMTR